MVHYSTLIGCDSKCITVIIGVGTTQTAFACIVDHSVLRFMFTQSMTSNQNEDRIPFSCSHKDESKKKKKHIVQVDILSVTVCPTPLLLSDSICHFVDQLTLHDDQCYISHIQVSFLY